MATDSEREIPLQSAGLLFYDCLKRKDPDTICLIDNSTKKETTNGEFLKTAISLAQKLAETGVQKGDVVTIISQNSVNFLATVFAAFYIGARVNLLNPDYLLGELEPLLAIARPRVIFCTSKSLSQIQKLTDIEATIINYDDSFKIRSLKNFTPVSVDLEDVAIIVTSSGTTGFPKCVLLTHSNFRACLFYHGYRYQYDTKDDTILAYLPLFHIYGIVLALSRLYYGNRVVLMEKFNPEQFLQAIQEYKIKVLFVVPPVIHFLIKSPLVEKYDLSLLKVVDSGGAPLSQETERAVLEKLSLKWVRQSFGMTETTGGIMTVPLNEKKIGSIGKACIGLEARICDVDTGRVLSANQVGELRFKGDLVMKGYLGNEEATKQAFDEEGFLKSGDLGYFDDEGFYFIVGRLKELIKYKGFQVSPTEIEAILFEHPAVEDCAVVGVPNEESGELTTAFVVKKSRVDVDKEELVRYVDERISVQKRLYGGVRFIAQIPKSNSGKILRRKLTQLL